MSALDWIDTSKQLPDDDICVLIALADGEVWTGFRDGEIWRYVSSDPMESAVTHWMHLPAAPMREAA